MAGNWLAHQSARLVRLPGALRRDADDLLTANPQLAAIIPAERFSSVYGMTPGSPLVTALAPAPLAPGVTGHSIIAVKGDGPLEDETDGVVAYSSAHLEGVASESGCYLRPFGSADPQGDRGGPPDPAGTREGAMTARQAEANPRKTGYTGGQK